MDLAWSCMPWGNQNLWQTNGNVSSPLYVFPSVGLKSQEKGPWELEEAVLQKHLCVFIILSTYIFENTADTTRTVSDLSSKEKQPR